MDEPGWDVDPEDEIASAVEIVGDQLKFLREAAGLRVPEFAEVIGYGEDLVRKIERGARIPRPEYLDKVDEVLDAGGQVRAMKPRMARARYPRKVRELADMEARAVELGFYSNHTLHGLLQTEDYARALLDTRRPLLSAGELERAVAARMARNVIYERDPAPDLSFVQEEVSLRRPTGGRMVWRRQLERLLQVSQLPGVSIQVMPTARWEHPGNGRIQVMRFADGSGIGRTDDEFGGRPVSDPRQLRILELRYGIIRAEALTPRESLAFIEQVLGET
ncbi:helix-turn-helix domain-containing protein [Streptomyces sp. cg35]|uniref:helix-turn-helix domain-containing protein n=1 Tax=Streptomyces sp. cg35 TaxID=3421650 RepID=UPI003D164E0E